MGARGRAEAEERAASDEDDTDTSVPCRHCCVPFLHRRAADDDPVVQGALDRLASRIEGESYASVRLGDRLVSAVFLPAEDARILLAVARRAVTLHGRAV